MDYVGFGDLGQLDQVCSNFPAQLTIIRGGQMLPVIPELLAAVPVCPSVYAD